MNRDRPTVLLVNDCHDSLELIGLYLREKLGCRVLTAPDGRRGLELMRRCEVDSVFLNLQMPVLDGYGVLAEMGRSEALRRLPVVIWTATAAPAGLAAFDSCGVASLRWLSIPHDLQALEEALSLSLGSRWEVWTAMALPAVRGRAYVACAAPKSRRAAMTMESLDLLALHPMVEIEGWGDLRGPEAARRREWHLCLALLLWGSFPVMPLLWLHSPGFLAVLVVAALLCCLHAYRRLLRAEGSEWRAGAAPKVVLALIVLAHLGLAHFALLRNLGPGYPGEVARILARNP